MKERDYRSAPRLAKTGIRRTIPAVNEELSYWKSRAIEIPNPNLREQAMMSIESKTFHAQGGGIYSMLAGENWRDAVTFIVAYQTISDYLDNLCDRSDLLDPIDFRLLHQSMLSIFNLSTEEINYYQYRDDQDDGGYLAELVQVCQDKLRQLPSYPVIKNDLLNLATKYIDLQVDKHVVPHEREDRLVKLFEESQQTDPTMTWYEYAATTGSTLAIFCLVSYAHREEGLTQIESKQIYDSYFPYVQGLHILLDYLIDQEEDKLEGDLNFCFYYPTNEKMVERMVYFIKQSEQAIRQLPDEHFHRYIYQGLIALYLKDPKVNQIENGKQIKKTLLKAGGARARFFHYGLRLINRYTKKTDQVL